METLWAKMCAHAQVFLQQTRVV